MTTPNEQSLELARILAAQSALWDLHCAERFHQGLSGAGLSAPLRHYSQLSDVDKPLAAFALVEAMVEQLRANREMMAALKQHLGSFSHPAEAWLDGVAFPRHFFHDVFQARNQLRDEFDGQVLPHEILKVWREAKLKHFAVACGEGGQDVQGDGVVGQAAGAAPQDLEVGGVQSLGGHELGSLSDGGLGKEPRVGGGGQTASADEGGAP